MKKCYIFGAAEGLPDSFKKEPDDLIIAADAGYLHLRLLGIKPDITVGDFDSLRNPPESGEVIGHPVRKDDTDTLLAVKIGLKKGYKSFVLYGCTGKRFDHTVANIQVLSFIASNGCECLLCGEDFTATVISSSTVRFSQSAKGDISVFSVSGASDGVNIHGLSYELDNARLSSYFPLGMSNKFIGCPSEISVKDGELLIIRVGKFGPLDFYGQTK